MINYTERLTLLMHDIVSRVPTLSFIDVADVLVFARSGRSNAEGAFATCHSLSLPASEPGYYFWRDPSRKGRFYPGVEPWMAKLDTVVHELYHIDPEQEGIRRIELGDGTYSAHCHGHQFFAQVAGMVSTYMAS